MEEATEARPAERREAIAGQADAGARLDRFMALVWPDLSRSRCKALVEAGHVQLDGAPARDPSAKLRPGVRCALDVPAPVPAAPEPEAIPLAVLFEDAHLIVIDKPAGLAVHPAVGNWRGTLVHALLHHCAGALSGVGGVERPGVVHRLDKDTSGVMVAAKTDRAHRGLAAQFAAHSVERAYLALCRGAPAQRAGRIETKIARSAHDRQKQAVLALDAARGKIAVTNYVVRAAYGQAPGASAGTPLASRIECRLETGRTHQIRVHLAYIGCPLLGDPVYGKGRSLRLPGGEADAGGLGLDRQALHAALLGFEHPVSGARLRFEAPPPADMAALEARLAALKGRWSADR